VLNIKKVNLYTFRFNHRMGKGSIYCIGKWRTIGY